MRDMQINEKDIFDYVFFPDEVDKIKTDEITNNEAFALLVKYYSELKKEMDTELSHKQKNIIKEKIPAYTGCMIYILHPVKVEGINKSDMTRYAADSMKLDRIIADTYIDKSKKYIVRVIKEDGNLKIYPLTSEDISKSDITIILNPSKKAYKAKFNAKPVEINEIISIESIEIEIS